MSLIEDGVTGLLRAPDAASLGDALVELAGSPLRRQALSAAALRSVRARTWERAMGLLAGGYATALEGPQHTEGAGARKAA